jgi:hypothetical protein
VQIPERANPQEFVGDGFVDPKYLRGCAERWIPLNQEAETWMSLGMARQQKLKQ